MNHKLLFLLPFILIFSSCYTTMLHPIDDNNVYIDVNLVNNYCYLHHVYYDDYYMHHQYYRNRYTYYDHNRYQHYRTNVVARSSVKRTVVARPSVKRNVTRREKTYPVIIKKDRSRRHVESPRVSKERKNTKPVPRMERRNEKSFRSKTNSKKKKY